VIGLEFHGGKGGRYMKYGWMIVRVNGGCIIIENWRNLAMETLCLICFE